MIVRASVLLLTVYFLSFGAWPSCICKSVGSGSLEAHAAPPAPRSADPRASSPESFGGVVDPCDCIEGDTCSSFEVPQGKEPLCYSGVCDDSCRCQPRPLNVGCAPTTQIDCVVANYSCDQGECKPTYTNLVGPRPAGRCDEVIKDGLARAVMQSWSLQTAPCAWKEIYTDSPRPADTCELGLDRKSLIKSTGRFDGALCSYKMQAVAGYPKLKPSDCNECTADTSLATCDWVRPVAKVCEKPAEISTLTCRVGGDGTFGIEERSVFSVDQCRFNITTTEVPRPKDSCLERTKGREAVVTKASDFVLTEDKKGCRWLFEDTTIKGGPPSCRFDGKTGKAYRDLFELSESCVYDVRSQEIPKPAPECFDSGFKNLVLRQATTFDARAGLCEWNTGDTNSTKPASAGCKVSGGVGTYTPVKIVSDLQTVPPVCRWEVGAPSVVIASDNTCEYKPGISTPSESELSSMSGQELDQLISKLGSLTLTEYAIDPQTCSELKQEYVRYWPQELSCEDSGRKETWTAHDSLLPVLNGVRVEPCSWVGKQESCVELPPSRPPVRAPVGGGAVSVPAPPKPASPPSPPAPAAPVAPAKCNYYTVASTNFIGSNTGLNYTAGAVRSCIQSRLTWATGECAKKKLGAEFVDDCIAGQIAPGASVMLNAQCQVIPEAPAGAVLCSSAVYGYRMSPVSLVWSTSESEAELALSNFPLFSDRAKKVVVWRASDLLPLVVYDPEHKGVIASREQLFGEHFSGGAQGVPWRDGYEALGSLDKNSDGELSGAELEPLALWFDSNRDGVSQPGEVRRLNHYTVNVTKLFFRGGVKSKRSSDIDLAVGFERIRGSSTELGGSVDWYAEGAGSKEALINKLTLLSRIETGAVLTAPIGQGSKAVSQQRVVSPLNGAFVWFSTDEPFAGYPKGTPGGAMTFTEYSSGKVVGHLYVETDYAEGGPVKSQLDTISVVGTVESLADGSKRLAFNPLRNSLPGTEFNSTAVLSADGAMLLGETSVILNYNGDIRRFAYTWRADKQ